MNMDKAKNTHRPQLHKYTNFEQTVQYFGSLNGAPQALLQKHLLPRISQPCVPEKNSLICSSQPMAASEAACCSSSWQAWGESDWAAVLSQEDELRLCPETQAAYAAAEQHTSSIDWLTVTEGLQEWVLLEAGVPAAELTAALAAMRSAPYR